MVQQSHSDAPPNARQQRQLRLGELLRHALSDILLRGDFRNPDLAGCSITVSEVRVSTDLRAATVYVSSAWWRGYATRHGWSESSCTLS